MSDFPNYLFGSMISRPVIICPFTLQFSVRRRAGSDGNISVSVEGPGFDTRRGRKYYIVHLKLGYSKTFSQYICWEGILYCWYQFVRRMGTLSLALPIDRSMLCVDIGFDLLPSLQFQHTCTTKTHSHPNITFFIENVFLRRMIIIERIFNVKTT